MCFTFAAVQKATQAPCFFQVCLVLLRRKIKALENPMFLGTTGDRTIFQIMTRHGADIGSFSVRILTTFGAF